MSASTKVSSRSVIVRSPRDILNQIVVNSMKEEDQSSLLIRLDERTSTIQKDLASIKKELDGRFVTVDQFEPIKKIVYGMVGIILLTFMGALVALIIN